MLSLASFNAYELIALIIWLRKDPVYNKRLRSFFNQFIQPKTRDHSINNNLFVLTNVEGKTVLMEQNATTHFYSLDLFWK
uniref:Uncharacterized protein n=1 Tax=Acrobeloides nanus TaxID=290746 RepID=A0A914D3D1_9BILA